MKQNIIMESFVIAVLFCCMILPTVAQQPANTAKKEAGQAVDSEEDLRRAIEAAAGSPTEFMQNLEAYLQKYPQSARRAEIDRELYKTALEQRDRNRTIAYAERLILSNGRDVDVLTMLVSTLRERRGAGDLQKALGYAEQLVKEIETLINQGARPRRLSQAQWNDRKEKGLGSVLLLRGRVQADLNNDSAAQSDLQKSFKLARLAGAAQSLGELAEKKKASEEAIEHYIQAFVISLVTDEELDRKALRARLGQLYTAKHGSENGLGDRLLKAYDAITKEREERNAKIEGPVVNAGTTDPLAYKLTKLEGGQVRLGDFRGKVVVVNFWATWCGPCLTEMPMLEKAMTKYQQDREVVFLALSTDEEHDDVAPFIKQHKFKLPIAFADGLDTAFRISSIPTTIIFNRSGEVSFRQAGFNPREDFVAKLSEKIEAAKK
ncbi:MAG: TlpA family protein disulfide reductase [Acidobacteria bacterium]|nr:TlpA family protein disulfide reductase [Acidobacteriota bacterium]